MPDPYAEIGSARIYNDDCYDVLPTLEENSVDCVIADPPYGTTQIEWDDEHPPLEPLWEKLYRVGKEDCVFVFYSAQPFTTDLIQSNREDWRYEIIWRKTMGTRFLDANRRPLQGHENIEVFIPGGHVKASTYNPQKWDKGTSYRTQGRHGQHHYNQVDGDYVRESNGLRHPLTVLTVSNGNSESPHPSAKPLELMRWLVRTYTNEGDRVLAPFCGSGRTGMAALREGRRFVGVEKSTEYAEKAADRIRSVATQPTFDYA